MLSLESFTSYGKMIKKMVLEKENLEKLFIFLNKTH